MDPFSTVCNVNLHDLAGVYRNSVLCTCPNPATTSISLVGKFLKLLTGICFMWLKCPTSRMWAWHQGSFFFWCHIQSSKWQWDKCLCKEAPSSQPLTISLKPVWNSESKKLAKTCFCHLCWALFQCPLEIWREWGSHSKLRATFHCICKGILSLESSGQNELRIVGADWWILRVSSFFPPGCCASLGLSLLKQGKGERKQCQEKKNDHGPSLGLFSEPLRRAKQKHDFHLVPTHLLRRP